MKYLLSLIVVILLINCRVNSQDPVYSITNYTTKDYGRDFNPSNMSVLQDNRGIIYAANGFRLLEYDGHTWNSYHINKETYILSLAINSSGLIYAGSQNEFGFFAPDRNGELKYQSLSDTVRQKYNFTNIWKVHAFSGGVVFQAEEELFLYRNGRIKIINPETSFHTSFIVDNKLFIRQRGIGLMELKDTSLVKIRGSEIFDTTGIFLMLPFGKSSKKILIGTQEKGFWIYEPEGGKNPFHEFKVDNLPLFEKSKITGGVLTGDGSIAISTRLNGVIIIDTTGKTKTIINSTNGLNDNEVKQPFPDREGNLWLALNNGISKVDISSPLSDYTEKEGISGSVNTIIRFNKLLYAGTSAGLFVQDQKGSEIPFKSVAGIPGPVWSLVEAEGLLLAGTDAGIFQISGSIVQLSENKSYSLLYYPGLKLLFSGGSKGLNAFKFERSFRKINSINIEGQDVTGIQAEKNRTGVLPEFWIGTRYNGAIRIKVNNDLSFAADHFGTSDGLPDGWVIPSTFGSENVFETNEGLYTFTNENIVKESLPDSLKNNKDFAKGYFSALRDTTNNFGKSVSSIADTKEKIWVNPDNNVGYYDKKNNRSFVSRPFLGIEVGKINYLFPEDNGLCWIGTTDGLIRYDENTIKDYDQRYYTLIRKVTLLNNDSAIFLGTCYKADKGYINILAEQPPGQKSTLTYAGNSIKFEFSAPFYEYQGKMVYSYKLEGSGSKWSQWEKENKREYNNLHEGNYTFTVKARNIYGKESSEARYSFTILAPWYRSVGAYIAYVIPALLLFWLFARLYSYRLKRENLRLEGIVKERTAEVVRQKDEIVSKNVLLEYQKKEIEDSIRYARRIQSAVIPSDNICHEIFPESFVVFKPLNIVSGDFYWVSRVGTKVIYTAADCTGHGVPGGFMSMLGIAFLNEIVNKDKITVPDLILNQLRDKVIQALQQQGISGETRDGMDIAVVSVDTREHILEYAGAYNPLILIRKGEIIETPGDKMPVGFYENMRPFSKHEISIEEGDIFYMFSDGYEDQFGGPEGKKFKAKRLKNLLLEIHKSPIGTQKELLEKNFEEWKGDLPQVDDVVIIGFSINNIIP